MPFGDPYNLLELKIYIMGIFQKKIKKCNFEKKQSVADADRLFLLVSPNTNVYINWNGHLPTNWKIGTLSNVVLDLVN